MTSWPIRTFALPSLSTSSVAGGSMTCSSTWISGCRCDYGSALRLGFPAVDAVTVELLVADAAAAAAAAAIPRAPPPAPRPRAATPRGRSTAARPAAQGCVPSWRRIDHEATSATDPASAAPGCSVPRPADHWPSAPPPTTQSAAPAAISPSPASQSPPLVSRSRPGLRPVRPATSPPDPDRSAPVKYPGYFHRISLNLPPGMFHPPSV